ncbi:hypothetical protein A2U01_0078977, partial [Trifolium medium]|nr:hypothetical protein [Trifolium medium]
GRTCISSSYSNHRRRESLESKEVNPEVYWAISDYREDMKGNLSYRFATGTIADSRRVPRITVEEVHFRLIVCDHTR